MSDIYIGREKDQYDFARVIRETNEIVARKNDRIAMLSGVLSNLFEVMSAIDPGAYRDACRQTGIYHGRTVAERALKTINQWPWPHASNLEHSPGEIPT